MAHIVGNPAAVSFELLFSRQDPKCITCPDTIEPCPNCGPGEECQQTVLTCDTCPSNFCATIPQKPQTSSSSSGGPSVGAIAGGVVGGLAAIGFITYLVWRFCIKGKRQRVETEDWDDEKEHQDTAGGAMLGDGATEKDFAARRDQRSSTHTAHSVASTVLTRASNIIQIAYIPGVTNRATPTSPTLLVPPVPPIPIAVSQASSPATSEDQHFFMPSDLRPDSTYSAMSGYSDRTSYARTSYAPRSSIASTIYGKSAVVVAPAQAGVRAKPAMVSVKSTGGSSGGSNPGPSTPPVPSVDYEKYGSAIPRPPSPAGSTFSVGSTFLNNATSASAHTAMAARPQVVRVGTGSRATKSSGSAGASMLSVSATPSRSPSVSSSAADSAPQPSPLGQVTNLSSPPSSTSARDSAAVTIIEESPRPDQGPFADPPRSPTSRKSNTSLSAVIEEATRRASHRDTSTGKTDPRERSPFGDEHATRDA